MRVGAFYNNQQCEFTVWAPHIDNITLQILCPEEHVVPMTKKENGYFSVVVNNCAENAQYLYQINQSQSRPDPASFYQPCSVHEVSQVVNHQAFHWHDEDWRGIPLKEMIIYELHAGTFTREGTFEAVVPRLKELKDIGINAIELMPVAQFPGNRNWGYDGVYPYAVQNSYGGPKGLKQLVDAAHQEGIAVVLDVVYNHLGPEGNYLNEFAPYFTQKYHTPWGWAVNFDDHFSDDVRNYFIQNALYWFENFHIDALRLDAIHAICDMSAKPFLEELAERVDEFSKKRGRAYYLIAESDLNDVRVVKTREEGGLGIHAQWSDDFHHSVHALLTGELNGYYQDFGQMQHIRKALTETFVYSGGFSRYRNRQHGNSAKDIPADKFVVCLQNHDQVGNRMQGERLSQLVGFEALKLAACSLLFSPYIPLLFMGEEYAEESPFLYFVSHSDNDLIEAVRNGRQNEFQPFLWKGEVPDPQAEETFHRSRINWEKRKEGNHKVMLQFYKYLICLRRKYAALRNLDKKACEVAENNDTRIISIVRKKSNNTVLGFMNFSDEKQVISPTTIMKGTWEKILDSADTQWGGPGSAAGKTVGANETINIQPLSFKAFALES